MTSSPHRFAIAMFTAVVAGSAFCGSAAAQFPAENVSLYRHLTLAELGSSFTEDCWGYVSASGREYAIVVAGYDPSERGQYRLDMGL